MFEFHEFLKNSSLIELIKDILVSTGMSSEDPDWKEDWSKVTCLTGWNSVRPGCKITILWKDELELEPDEGYIFTLPGWDSNDVAMSGIVHIPRPNGCVKCECDPEWHLFGKLTANEMVKEIIIKE